MTDITDAPGVKAVTADLTETQKKAFDNAEKIAKAVVTKLGKLGYIATPRVRMIQAPEYTFLETELSLADKKETNTLTVAYSEMLYAAPEDNAALLTLAKRVLRDVYVHMGIDPEAN